MLQNIFYATKFFKYKNISKKLKLKLKNTVIDKTLTYASETWTLTKRDRKQLNIFNGKELSYSAHAKGMKVLGCRLGSVSRREHQMMVPRS
jgi:trimethylamine:corrinoid methyltransferase-like protein